MMIKFKIYQCPITIKYWGMNFDWIKDKYPVRYEDYVLVYHGQINAAPQQEVLDSIFERFNLEKEKYFFYGRSLSVSDVVAIYMSNNKEWEYFYCDGIGWKQLKHFTSHYLDNHN